MSHGSLFTGVGLLDYGLVLAGLPEPVWVCEWDDWRRDTVLARRFPRAVRRDDVRTVGADTVEPVRLIAGGFPCKGASTAGPQNGFEHPETVLWREMARAVGELRPVHVLVENVANLLVLHDGAVWGEVLGTLAALGFDVEWDCIPAAAVGAPHRRDRVFAVATHPGRLRGELRGAAGAVAGAGGPVAGEARQRQRARQAVGGGGAAVADAPRPHERRDGDVWGLEDGRADARGDRYAVGWGEYAGAIERWERVLGRPAPEPVVRRVDDRRASRLDRSRLSAVGDGVQVQVGRLMGEHLLSIDPALAAITDAQEGTA